VLTAIFSLINLTERSMLNDQILDRLMKSEIISYYINKGFFLIELLFHLFIHSQIYSYFLQ
jgi:hypothetical protein